jgi:ADP-ribose pyrophosphatase
MTEHAREPDESRTVYDGKLLDVTLERWGEHEREIVEHPGAVAIVALDGDDRVTLVRQLREPARRRLLELPAGTCEAGEEPLATAQRELHEECGLRGGRWRELASFWTTPGFCREQMHLYLAEDVEQGEADADPDEEIELVRWPAAEIASRLGEVEDAKTLAGLLLYLHMRGPAGPA